MTTFPHDSDNVWMACIDGQMNASEAIAFDAQCSPAERERLAAEMRLEAGLAERLRDGGDCPEALWRRLELQMRNGAAPQARRTAAWRPLRWAAGLAAAAALAFGVFWQQARPGLPAAEPRLIALGAESVEQLAAQSQTAADAAAVEAFLREHDIRLALADFNHTDAWSHHEASVLGARMGNAPGGAMVEVLYQCCGRPAKIAVARRGTPGAARIVEAEQRGETRETVEIGDYIAAVVARHRTDDLLRVLKPV